MRYTNRRILYMQAARRKRRRWETAFLDATKHRLIQPRGQIRARFLPPLIGQKSSSSGIGLQLLWNCQQLSKGNSCSKKRRREALRITVACVCVCQL